MAYSTNNSSSTISITNLGANGDGVFDNKAIFQNAIHHLNARKGGTLFFPKGTYYFSNTVNVTGQDISFVGENGAIFLAGRDESAKKFNVSGAKRISFSNLTFDSNRTGSANVSNQYGFINTINTEDLNVNQCNFFNTKNSSIYLGGGTKLATIIRNYFTGHFCAIYGYINNGESDSEKFVISNNIFGNSWPGNTNESACIKLQTNGSAYSRGHIIDSNAISSQVQMGIELWSHGRDSVISNNNISNTAWGISLDNQENTTVVGNTIKGVSYMGIECASICKNITIGNNSINGYTGYLAVESRLTDYGISSSNTASEKIVYNGNTVEGCDYGFNVQNTLDTIISNNIIQDNNINLYFQAGRRSQIYGNLFDTGKNASAYHIFLDAASIDLSGFHISNNKFRGATTNQSIYYYNNSTSNKIYDICIENNVTDQSTYGGYGYFMGGQLTPYNYVYRNNFAPSGAGVSNSIQDASDSNSAYPTTASFNGYKFYSRGTMTLTGAINSTSGAWTKIYSRTEGNIQIPRFAFDFNELSPPYSFDGGKDVFEFVVAKAPYGGAGNIMVLPQTDYWINIIEQIAVDNPAADATIDVWLKFQSGSAGISGLTIYFYGDDSLITSPTLQYQRPNFDGSAVILDLKQTSRNNLKLTRGIGFGTGPTEIYSPSSGIIQINASGGLNLYGNAFHKAAELSSYKTITSNYSLLSTDNRVYCNNSSNITLTFPDATTVDGMAVKIKLVNNGSVTLTGTYRQTFDGLASTVQSGRYSAFECHATGAGWNLW
jgi:hypothetical protein